MARKVSVTASKVARVGGIAPAQQGESLIVPRLARWIGRDGGPSPGGPSRALEGRNTTRWTGSPTGTERSNSIERNPPRNASALSPMVTWKQSAFASGASSSQNGRMRVTSTQRGWNAIAAAESCALRRDAPLSVLIMGYLAGRLSDRHGMFRPPSASAHGPRE